MRSLFLRLQRYPRSPGRDPREDRLTEALAVTLDAAPCAATFLVREFFDRAPTGSLKVNTQVHTPAGGRVDLELCFGAPGKPELLVWFENKVGSDPYAAQGCAYIGELEKRNCESKFSWLIKVDQEVAGDPPPHAHCHSWQDLGSCLRFWLDSVPADRRAECGPWFVLQFLDHLEREEKLAFTKSFTDDDAAALDRYDLAAGRFRELLEQARISVAHKWHDPHPGGDWCPRSSRQDFWLTFPSARNGEHSPWSGSCWFEWHGRHDDARETPEELWVLGAGVAFKVEEAPLESEYPEFFEQLRQLGFEDGQSGGRDGRRYIFKYLTLRELVAKHTGDLGAQAQALAGWVVATFDSLNGLEMPEGFPRSGPDGLSEPTLPDGADSGAHRTGD